jgi:hypothetical protein
MRSFLQLAGTLIVAAVIPVAAARGQVRLTVDAGKTGAPISKYVYGQFAEHLGRSIYGGLWAEPPPMTMPLRQPAIQRCRSSWRHGIERSEGRWAVNNPHPQANFVIRPSHPGGMLRP